jgi:protein-S-isoprenylcysteine O-methyltransferase Ste14
MLRSVDSAQGWAVGSFCAIVVFHLAFRLYVKAHKARTKPRGEIHQPKLFGQMVMWYVVFFLAAVVEWALGIWPFHWNLAVLGGLLYLASMLIQWSALNDLGQAYSPDIEVRQQQTLVQIGLYRWMRHPLLAAIILELLGVTLFLNAYVASFGVALVFIPVIRKRRQEEEKVLLEHFGAAYRRYCAEVGAYFPKFIRRIPHDVNA